MSDPSLECTARIQPAELASGTWIVMLRADQIPHVALLQEGVVLSLEHDGSHRYPHEKLWRLIESRRTPALLCRLDVGSGGPAAPFFEAQSRLEVENNCFVPVRDYCASWFPPGAACEYAYQLIPLLASAGRVQRAGGFHLRLEGATFRFPVYDKDDIRDRKSTRLNSSH